MRRKQISIELQATEESKRNDFRVCKDFEDRQQMRDRWLRDAFTVPEQINRDEQRSSTNSMDEEEAIRLLIDYGISEEKAKVRLQVGATARYSSIGQSHF